MQQKFLVTDIVPDGFIEELEGLGFKVDHFAKMNTEGLAPIAHEYDGMVINTHMQLDKKMLDAAVKLKYILRPGSGLDNLDVAYAENKGIWVFSSPEGNKEAVGEHALGLLLGVMNNIARSAWQVKNREWIRQENTGVEIKGKTIGIIGYGNTGSAFAKKLKGFEAQLLVYDKYKTDIAESYVSPATMQDIYEQADIVSLHLPLTAETRHLVKEKFIGSFYKPFYLINTARGKIVNTQHLLKGLQQGKILGAGLDVLENELFSTYTEEENQIFETLISMPNVLVTPHIAGWTVEARRKIFFIVLEKFKKRFSAANLSL